MLERLRAILVGWPGVVLFLVVPFVVLAFWPGDPDWWIRWSFGVPLIALYVWACWPRPD